MKINEIKEILENKGYTVTAINSKSVEYICPKCGNTEIKSVCSVSAALQKDKISCSRCYNIKNKKEIIADIEAVEGYTVLSDDLNLFQNKKTNILVRHSCGNEFLVKHNNFTNKKSRCPECAKLVKLTKLRRDPNLLNLEIQSHDINYVIDNVLDYENKKTKLNFRHLKCDNVFETTLDQFIHNGKRCPFCNPKIKSKNEKIIGWFLRKNNIKFEEQISFADLVLKNKLYFDFKIYLNENDYFLLEYDGEQHFNPRRESDGVAKLKLTQDRDAIKNQYCASNNIDLVRINYLQETIPTLIGELSKRNVALVKSF